MSRPIGSPVRLCLYGCAHHQRHVADDRRRQPRPARSLQPVLAWWNKYQIDPDLGGGLGVIYFSDSFASSDDTVRLPGFVRFDAAVYTKINETWRVQLNVENIFNKGYWATADGNNNISPGQPRTFRLSAMAKF